MASLNKVQLIGRVGKDPEVRQFDGGGKVANFTFATDESYTDRSGQRVSATEWHNIVLNGKNADLAQYIHKGSQLYLEGKIKTRKWTGQDGVEHDTKEIQVFVVQLLDPKPQQPQSPAQPVYPPAQPAYPPQAPVAPPQQQYQQPPMPPQAPVLPDQPQFRAPQPPAPPAPTAPPQYAQKPPMPPQPGQPGNQQYPPMSSPAYGQEYSDDLPF